MPNHLRSCGYAVAATKLGIESTAQDATRRKRRNPLQFDMVVSISIYWLVMAGVLFVWAVAMVAILCDSHGWHRGFSKGAKIWKDHSDWLTEQLKKSWDKERV